MATPAARIIAQYIEHHSGPIGGTSRDMRVAGSLGTPGVFRWVNAGGTVAILDRITGLIRDNTGAAPEKFGGLVALTNGVLFEVIDGTGAAVKEFGPFQNNAEFFSLTASSVPVLMLTGSVFIPIPWTPGNSGMAFPPGWGIQVLIRDDLSTLDEFDFYIQGSASSTQSVGTASRI
jgi:hypothetical protein